MDRWRVTTPFWHGQWFRPIFLQSAKIFKWGAFLDHPRGVTTPKINKKMFWVKWHQSKAYQKLNSNMSIICSFDPHLTVSNWTWLENHYFDNCLIEVSMSTPNDKGSWFLTWTLTLTYIFIFWTKIGWGGTQDPPWGGGGINKKLLRKKCWVIWHIYRKPM